MTLCEGKKRAGNKNRNGDSKVGVSEENTFEISAEKV